MKNINQYYNKKKNKTYKKNKIKKNLGRLIICSRRRNQYIMHKYNYKEIHSWILRNIYILVLRSIVIKLLLGILKIKKNL